ncbi:MAG: transposase [Planctomycetaceae bacterium]|nr:transposase [Planctomycetaceae bacterium]
MTDAQWELFHPLIVLPTGGRPRTTDLRQVLNAILYQAKTGCPWHILPRDFSPEVTVRDYFHKFKRNHVLEEINETLRKQVRFRRQARYKVLWTSVYYRTKRLTRENNYQTKLIWKWRTNSNYDSIRLCKPIELPRVL